MIARLMEACARRRGLVLALFALLALAAELARRQVPLDAIPDLSDPQVVLLTRFAGHPTEEVEAQVTAPLSRQLQAIAGVRSVRGTSMPGMSFLHVLPAPGTPVRVLGQRLAGAAQQLGRTLPSGAELSVGSNAGATGWVYQYALVWIGGGPIAVNLRRLQDRTVKPALEKVAGVAEVASIAGAQDAYHLEIDPGRLAAAGLTGEDLARAVRARDQSRALSSLSIAPVGAGAGAGGPTRLLDVARVRMGPSMEMASADWGGGSPAVGGIVLAVPGADVPAVIAGVKARLAQLRLALPRGVDLVTVYDRSGLIERAGRMLTRALLEEILVVSAVALLFLLHLRSALLPMLTLPLVTLLPFLALWLFEVPVTLMSLGGIAISLGMAVDAELVMLDACHKRLESAPPQMDRGARASLLMGAARETTPAMVASLLIAAVIFLPVFAFTGETGRLLRPLALTKTLVILAAAAVSATLAPALRDLLVRGRIRPESANPVSRALLALYRPFVYAALQRPLVTVLIGALAIVSCLPLLGRLGGEFMPAIDEGDLLFMPTTLPGASAQSVAGQLERQNQELRRFAEVGSVFGKAGRAETATDPAPGHMIETNLRLRPRDQWPKVVSEPRWHSGFSQRLPGPVHRLLDRLWPTRRARTLPELIAVLNERLSFVGWTNAWTMPIRGRTDMLATGVRTPVGVRVTAASPERLARLGAELKPLLGRLPGTRSVLEDAAASQRTLEVTPDLPALERQGVDLTRLRAVVAASLGPTDAGTLSDGRYQYRVSVVPPRDLGGDPVALGEVAVPAGSPPRTVPLALLGQVVVAERPAMLNSQDGRLVQTLHVNLSEGRDVARFALAAQAAIDGGRERGALRLLPGESVQLVGEYELIAATRQRLLVVVPAVAVLVVLLLYWLLRRVIEVLIVVLSVPFAAVGCVWLLYLLDYRLSAAVWVGILALIGLATQTGVVMILYLDQAFYRRLRAGRIKELSDIVAAHIEGSVQRLRPKIMTVATMVVGLAPLLWASEGGGAEILKRVAAPMVGGLLTSAFLTLEIIPVVHTRWRQGQLRRALRSGRPLAEVVGPPPGWARD